MVGQMQVSCYLCTEHKGARALDNSMMTEFVLYDTAHARTSVAPQDKTNYSHDLAKTSMIFDESLFEGTCKFDEVSYNTKLKGELKHASDISHFDSTTFHPLAAAKLHRNLEIAAIVIQAPFGKRESLKRKGGDQKTDQLLPNLFDFSGVDQKKESIPDCLSKVNAVIPSGIHSLPSNESHGPSPLLDRWRLCGGCDCEVWDMACPLTVIGNPNIQSAESHLQMENQQPLVLVQGSKENTPALIITVIEDRQSAVAFHAKLSTLHKHSPFL
ncbi:unnamed protein product [Ilex paraguariensis]|uniref:Uncharacterized protein n=1 Tax=Ilex paraguariensis TaxID=185542 RepID=A0ABC8RGQ8_9AQUA